MIWIFLVILFIVFLVLPFLQKQKKLNRESYNSLSHEVQNLIVEEKIDELAKIIVNLELVKNNNMAGKILSGIEFKSFRLAMKVDKVRNKLRIESGLGRLKNF